MTAKKTPMRMCIGCRQMHPKSELIRAVKSPEGEVSLDATGRKNGRGAYICRSADCLQKAIKSNALSRAFSMGVEQTVYDRLKEELKLL